MTLEGLFLAILLFLITKTTPAHTTVQFIFRQFIVRGILLHGIPKDNNVGKDYLESRPQNMPIISCSCFVLQYQYSKIQQLNNHFSTSD